MKNSLALNKSPAYKLLLILASVAAIQFATAAPAHAGILESLAAKAMEHIKQNNANGNVNGTGTGSGSGKGGVLVPGRDGPLAPGSDTGFASCTNLFPGGKPIDTKKIDAQWRAVGLCSNHFAVLYSSASKTPLIVVEKLNSSMLSDAMGEERTNDFYPDPRLPRGQRAELEDYKAADSSNKRYDRGHMAPAADQPDNQSMSQSFALSNMIPQDPDNNRKGAWSKAEKDTRKYARRATGNVYVFSGPLFLQQPIGKLGRNQVWIPSHLFKLVYDESTGRSWAHIMTNAEMHLGAPVSYQEFVKQTGWNLLPAGKP